MDGRTSFEFGKKQYGWITKSEEKSWRLINFFVLRLLCLILIDIIMPPRWDYRGNARFMPRPKAKRLNFLQDPVASTLKGLSHQIINAWK